MQAQIEERMEQMQAQLLAYQQQMQAYQLQVTQHYQSQLQSFANAFQSLQMPGGSQFPPNFFQSLQFAPPPPPPPPPATQLNPPQGTPVSATTSSFSLCGKPTDTNDITRSLTFAGAVGGLGPVSTSDGSNFGCWHFSIGVVAVWRIVAVPAGAAQFGRVELLGPRWRRRWRQALRRRWRGGRRDELVGTSLPALLCLR